MTTTISKSGQFDSETPECEVSSWQFDLLSDLEEIRAITQQWQTLCKEVRIPNVFFEPDFLLPALEHLESQGVKLVCAWKDATRRELLVLVPILKHNRYYSLPVQHTEIWRHPYCFLCTPLVSKQLSDQTILALLNALGEKNYLCPVIFLSWLDQGSTQIHTANSNVQSVHAILSPWRLYHEPSPVTRAGLDIKGEFKDFLDSLRTKKRKELMRMRRRLQEQGDYQISFISEHSSESEQSEAINDFTTLENQGWKRAQGSSIASNAKHENYFKMSTSAGLKIGQVTIASLKLDDTPVAMLVLLISACGRAGYTQKIAFNSQFERFSPGSLVVLEMTEHIFNNKPHIDYLDSCAAESHPMINSLWHDRRSIGAITMVRKYNWRNSIITLTSIARALKKRLPVQQTVQLYKTK